MENREKSYHDFWRQKNKNKIKKDLLVWCDDPPEDQVISMFARLLVNNDRSHRRQKFTKCQILFDYSFDNSFQVCVCLKVETDISI
jgi:hypothetical protein